MMSKLAVQTWNVTILVEKMPELMCVLERYCLNIVKLTSTYSTGSKTKFLERAWTLFHTGVALGERW